MERRKILGSNFDQQTFQKLLHERCCQSLSFVTLFEASEILVKFETKFLLIPSGHFLEARIVFSGRFDHVIRAQF